MKFFCSRGRGGGLFVWLKMPNTIGSPLFEFARVIVRFDHLASFHLDELGASDFYLYINPPCACGAIFAADLSSPPILFSKNVLGGTTASHTCLVWGAVIF
jgi:hypothetical protein